MEWIVFVIRFVSFNTRAHPGAGCYREVEYRLAESHVCPVKSDSEPQWSHPLLLFESTRAGRLGPADFSTPARSTTGRVGSLNLPESRRMATTDKSKVDFSDIFDHEDQFVLRVKGCAMIADHINDGDFVVLRRQNTAENGDIVACVPNDGAAVLRRFYREENGYRLDPANATEKSIYADKVEVLGVVTAVIRKL